MAVILVTAIWLLRLIGERQITNSSLVPLYALTPPPVKAQKWEDVYSLPSMHDVPQMD